MTKKYRQTSAESHLLFGVFGRLVIFWRRHSRYVGSSGPVRLEPINLFSARPGPLFVYSALRAHEGRYRSG